MNDESLVAFIKQALTFYANSNNYSPEINHDGKVVSLIELDGGYQATFALKQIEIINSVNENLNDEMLKQFPLELENNETHVEFLNIVENLK